MLFAKSRRASCACRCRPRRASRRRNGPTSTDSMLMTTDQTRRADCLAGRVRRGASSSRCPACCCCRACALDYFPRIARDVDRSRASPRATASTDRLTVKGGVGLFAQEPTLRRDRPQLRQPRSEGRARLPLLGGRRVQAAPVHHASTRPGSTRTCTTWSARPSQSSPTRTEPSGRCATTTAARGSAYGLELVARHDFANNFTGWLAYTLSRSERLRSAPDHVPPVRLRSDAHPDRGRQLLAAAQLAGRRPLPLGQRQPDDAGRRRACTTPATIATTRSTARSTRRACRSFHQLDLRVDKRWVYQRWMLERVSRHPEHLQPRQPRGLRLQLQLPQVERRSRACRSCPSSASGRTSEEREPCAFAFIRSRLVVALLALGRLDVAGDCVVAPRAGPGAGGAAPAPGLLSVVRHLRRRDAGDREGQLARALDRLRAGAARGAADHAAVQHGPRDRERGHQGRRPDAGPRPRWRSRPASRCTATSRCAAGPASASCSSRTPTTRPSRRRAAQPDPGSRSAPATISSSARSG